MDATSEENGVDVCANALGHGEGAEATDIISNKEADWTVIGISRSGRIALVQIFISQPDSRLVGRGSDLCLAAQSTMSRTSTAGITISLLESANDPPQIHP